MEWGTSQVTRPAVATATDIELDKLLDLGESAYTRNRENFMPAGALHVHVPACAHHHHHHFKMHAEAFNLGNTSCIVAMTLTLQVRYGKSTHHVSVEQNAKVLEVMQLVEQVTEVPIRQQKLICQGKVLDSSSTVEGSNLTNGSRLMLITAGGQTQVVQTHQAPQSTITKLSGCSKSSNICRAKALCSKSSRRRLQQHSSVQSCSSRNKAGLTQPLQL